MVCDYEKVNIISLLYDSVADFAVSELKKYLKMMMPESININICKDENCSTCYEKNIKLGLLEQFDIDNSEVENDLFDDVIHIDVDGLCGVIAGSNARSILLGVYRFLHEAGCRWVRPGIDGEYIPEKDMNNVNVKLHEKAAYRHRGLCIEGAVSYENMAENIEWAPKVGFNSYFIEFITPYTFFDRWYSHKYNKYKKPEHLTVEMVQEFTAQLEKEIKKRGLVYHAVGHGWTCEPFGIPGLGWDMETYELDEETRKYFAEVNGKRDIWHGVPLNTNLCYSNLEARKKVVDYCADYVLKNNQIDVLHFWFADDVNNHCECEECRKAIPSDFYVKLLNELDDEFTRRGIKAKIVFLLYVDLLWTPEKEKIKNPDRFLILFAPITRTYSSPYSTEKFDGQLPQYNRNKLEFPRSVLENIAYLREWQKMFDGDSLVYEYHFMWDHYNDPGYYDMAKVLFEDIKRLKELKLNGLISDQTQRSFLPTGFGMYLMGRALWNNALEFEDIANDYFSNAFGDDGLKCKRYMEELSKLFNPVYIRGEKGRENKEAAVNLAKVKGVVGSFLPVIKKNIKYENNCIAKSWEYLEFHAGLVTRLADAFKARAEGNETVAAKLWEETSDYAQCNEDAVQPVFDLCTFVQSTKSKFKAST
ncbi:MAG TPA: DUF4838 domain-containing protein [Clostridiales bacterium]|nr:DUF4838 domain-containing protein [Clostridiales bacterium]